MFWGKQGFHITCLLRGKQKYQVTKLARRAKLSRLLLQRIIEFKMNENQRKTPVVINLYVIFGP